MTLNDHDTLYFEASTGKNSEICGAKQNPFSEYLLKNLLKQSVYPAYDIKVDYQMAVGMGASLNYTYLYGLSERESVLLLTDTVSRDPYRFFNIDYYAH